MSWPDRAFLRSKPAYWLPLVAVRPTLILGALPLVGPGTTRVILLGVL